MLLSDKKSASLNIFNVQYIANKTRAYTNNILNIRRTGDTGYHGNKKIYSDNIRRRLQTTGAETNVKASQLDSCSFIDQTLPYRCASSSEHKLV